MRHAGILLLLLAAFLVAGCGGTDNADSAASSTGAATTELRPLIIDASGGERVRLQVEIADTDAERQRGLMERTALGENRGMLFVFEDEQTLSFWMKNTLIPLSVAYMDSEGRIVDIQKMEPAPEDASDAELPRYPSAEPARYALEVNQGFFEEYGVEVGDMVELPV